jgi:mono/diheme cytochrome c family protein
MTPPYHVTTVEAELARRRRRLRPITIAAALLVALVLIVLLAGIWNGIGLLRESTTRYEDIRQHFKYGSIGTEPESGIPFKLWKALPHLFPEAFDNRNDYAAFGFLYESVDGRTRDLPIGISKRRFRGVDLVWFNCAVCHTGTYQAGPKEPEQVVLGMPSNNLRLHAFIEFILSVATDERLAPDRVFDAIEQSQESLGWLEKAFWRFLVLPTVREALLVRHARLSPLLAKQPPWGPGRVDTFNPYKLIQMGIPIDELGEEEIIGASDFPSIFLQGPRDGLQLHWDGNNASLQERNLSAAIGAGVTPETVDHPSIERVADWLKTLPPPPSPHQPGPEAARRGLQSFMENCALCHGYRDEDRYVFEGSQLGLVDDISAIRTDPGRLNSYTQAFRDRQLAELFAGTPYQFKHFQKTNGYANMPLDGLWLRAPYLHNGSVPTLADLLKPADDRPEAFIRGMDVIDRENGGFQAPACEAGMPLEEGFCYDTTQPGNRRGGHEYGTALEANERNDLLEYLKTF